MVYQTCYGFGMGRVLAALIAQHGDDHGLVLPPVIAPVQAVIVPIPYKGYEEALKVYCSDMLQTLVKAGVRSLLDDSDKMRPGEKFYHWEMLGVPVRIEVGPQETQKKTATLVRRDTLKRTSASLAEIVPRVQALMDEISESMRKRSKESLEKSVIEAQTLEDVRKGLDDRKMVKVNWCGKEECALRINEQIGGEIRGYRFDENEEPNGPCMVCGAKADKVVYVSRTY